MDYRVIFFVINDFFKFHLAAKPHNSIPVQVVQAS